jgi:hypothetical protein
MQNNLTGNTSGTFKDNLTFENSSMFDENNNEKKFIGSQKLNKHKSKMANAHKMLKKVVHNGRGIKTYTDGGRTLFCTMRETMNSDKSGSHQNSPMKTLMTEEEKDESPMKGMVTKVERENEDGKT